MTLNRLQSRQMTPWSPMRQLSTLREEIDRLFESPLEELTRASQQFLSGWLPSVDLYEDKDNLTVVAEIPGVTKEEIDISLQNQTLTISGERKETQTRKDGGIYRSERSLGRFQRTLSLPLPVQADKVKAAYKDGLLTVTLPKAEEAKPKQIHVNIA